MNRMPIRISRSKGWATLAVLALGAIVIGVGFWPGIMIDDTRWQYQQSVDNSYEDWHPTLMAWIWRRLMFVQPGPAPMFLLQLALYWAGIGLVAYWAYRRGRPRLALAVALAGWLPAPLALTGTVTKDCLMAGALGSATGLLLIRDFARTKMAHIGNTAGAVVLILFAAALRLNADVACLPLLLVAIPRQLTRTRARLAASAVTAALGLVAIGPLINNLVAAEKTDVALSLIILAGSPSTAGSANFPISRSAIRSRSITAATIPSSGTAIPAGPRFPARSASIHSKRPRTRTTSTRPRSGSAQF